MVSRMSYPGCQPKDLENILDLGLKRLLSRREVISVDGKTACGSRDRNNNRNPFHTVSAWANNNRFVLVQEAVDDNSNEITAIPKLLALLELKGCIITIDAMSCQREIISQILEQGSDYVWSWKGNQTGLHTVVKAFVEYDFQEKIDNGHGHLEIRHYWITEHLESWPSVEKWKGLITSIGMVERICWVAGNETSERRYFITSMATNAKRFAKAVREHWSIENRLSALAFGCSIS